MNARFPGFALPIFLVRFTSGRTGEGRSDPLDIGSAEAMVFMPGDARQHSHLEGFGAVAQGMFAIPSSGPSALPKFEFLRDELGVPEGGEGGQGRCQRRLCNGQPTHKQVTRSARPGHFRTLANISCPEVRRMVLDTSLGHKDRPTSWSQCVCSRSLIKPVRVRARSIVGAATCQAHARQRVVPRAR